MTVLTPPTRVPRPDRRDACVMWHGRTDFPHRTVSSGSDPGARVVPPSAHTIPRPRVAPSAGTGVEDAAPRAARFLTEARLGLAFIAAGVVMVPWLFVLAAMLPSSATAGNWSAAWVGLDTLEALSLVATGALARRRDPRMSLAAMATSVLLLVDAWFDVLTATPAQRPVSIAMAVLLELPISSFCAVLAVRRLSRDLSRAQRSAETRAPRG